MNFFSKKKKDEQPIEMNNFSQPAAGGGYSYSGQNNASYSYQPPNNSNQINASQQQYDQQFTKPLINYNDNQDPTSNYQNNQYHTIVDDQTGDNQVYVENPHEENKYVAQIKELMKMEGKSPLCKAFTYINIILGLFIFYLIIRSF